MRPSCCCVRHRDQNSSFLSLCISARKIQSSEASGHPKKKRKKTQKKFREQEQKASEHKAKTLGEKKSPVAPGTKKPEATKGEKPSTSTGAPAGKGLQGTGVGLDADVALSALKKSPIQALGTSELPREWQSQECSG